MNNFPTNIQPSSICTQAKSIAIEVYDQLRCYPYVKEAEFVVKLLAKSHIKSLILSMDTVANKAYLPTIKSVPYEVDEDYECVSTVNLIKADEPLGATITIKERTGAVQISKIMPGGTAARTMALDPGDVIREVNGVSTSGKNSTELIQLLTTLNRDVQLKVHPSMKTKPSTDQDQVFVKALFSYRLPEDASIPGSNDIPLPFHRGDVFQLINTEHSDWWQALKVENRLTGSGSIDSSSDYYNLKPIMKGLIPSVALRERNQTQACPGSPSLCYELVTRYFPEPGWYRPIVLVGPPGVGKSELIQQLINTDPDHFQRPLRITNRKPRPDEQHGVDYLFVTTDEFNTFVEADSLLDKIVEDALGSHTALCTDAVSDIMQDGKVAVFKFDFRNLHQIRSSLWKPFVVFIKPPPLDVLLETRSHLLRTHSPHTQQTILMSPTRQSVHSVPSTPTSKSRFALHSSTVPAFNHSPTHQNLSTSITPTPCVFDCQEMRSDSCLQRLESNFQQMLQLASLMNETHGHLWDAIIVNDDLPVALEKLSELAYCIETQPQWIPNQWLHN